MKLLEKLLDSKTKKKKERENEILRRIRLAIPAQGASVSPPLGPVLGQFGINILDFCKQFNEKSQVYDVEVVLNVVIVLFKNKNFLFEIKQPSFSYMFYESYFFDLLEDIQRQMKSNNNEDCGGDKEDEVFFRTLLEYEYPKFCFLSWLFKIALLRSHISGEDLKRMFRMLKASVKSMHVSFVDDITLKNVKKQ